MAQEPTMTPQNIDAQLRQLWLRELRQIAPRTLDTTLNGSDAQQAAIDMTTRSTT